MLIADDGQEIRDEPIDCLAASGFECVEALNGEEGLDILRRDTKITIVSIDTLMPGKSGLEMVNAAQMWDLSLDYSDLEELFCRYCVASATMVPNDLIH